MTPRTPFTDSVDDLLVLADADRAAASGRHRPLGRLAWRLVRAALPPWHHGTVTVHLPGGRRECIGDPASQPRVALWVDDERFFREFLLRGDLGAGESYMRGDWRADDLPRFIEMVLVNAGPAASDTWWTRLLTLPATIAHALRVNPRRGARRNIRAHYDLSNDFFALFLDPTLAYSSAIFDTPDEPLEQAQRRKFDALARRLGLRPGHRVLEIGCGWGGFAIHAAATYGCHVTGVTISREQHALATRRVSEAGLSDRVDLRLCDYRDVTGRFDRIVSIEMLEAIGRRQWRTFFARCNELLAPHGSIGLQVITVPDHRFAAYTRSADWIQTHIFPGSSLGSLSGFIAAMAQAGTVLTVRSVEDIGPHYAETLRHWRQRFLARLADVRRLGFDERFIRMWDFYLASCEAYFRTRSIADLQIVLGRAGEGWSAA